MLRRVWHPRRVVWGVWYSVLHGYLRINDKTEFPAKISNFPPKFQNSIFPPKIQISNFPPKIQISNFPPKIQISNFPPKFQMSKFQISRQKLKFQISRQNRNFEFGMCFPDTHVLDISTLFTHHVSCFPIGTISTGYINYEHLQ
jgi:hypothetical protein